LRAARQIAASGVGLRDLWSRAQVTNFLMGQFTWRRSLDKERRAALLRLARQVARDARTAIDLVATPAVSRRLRHRRPWCERVAPL